ncbi:MAG TPA: hypothetical protein VJS45_07230 [Acidimicrobiia bacterium]|nr:hypothetical protein [Acidimicrobiia bacterium]
MARGSGLSAGRGLRGPTGARRIHRLDLAGQLGDGIPEFCDLSVPLTIRAAPGPVNLVVDQVLRLVKDRLAPIEHV